MPVQIFELAPRLSSQGDHAWQLSWHRGSCRVIASSAMRARLWAAGAFTLPVSNLDSNGGPAWLQPSLVSVRRLRLRRNALVEGIVLVPDASGWVPVNAGTSRWMDRKRIAEVVTAGSHPLIDRPGMTGQALFRH